MAVVVYPYFLGLARHNEAIIRQQTQNALYNKAHVYVMSSSVQAIRH